ncbi:glycosyltransferase [Leuconostoc lactis]|uniref:glycosyltransferase n=1 Tax=Leuconostoc lactis TaxID=1246 RepID=UPI00241E702A|nr:glycosyltransferase [Leuconostoc lactis]
MRQNREEYPKFSVLMSVYSNENAEHFKEALLSIKHQTIPCNDFVLVVDGPISKKLEIVIEQFKDQLPLNIVRLPINKGLGYALSEGLKHTKYDIVARADSDDINYFNRFEIQLPVLNKNRNVSIVGGQISEFNNSSDVIENVRFVPLSHKQIQKFSKKRSPFNHPTVVFRKDKIQEVGGYVDYPPFEDYHLWMRILDAGLITENVSDIVVKMRAGNNMYGRRGGLTYFIKYVKLRSLFLKQRYIGSIDYIISVMLMSISMILPTKIRKKMYGLFLRRSK